MDGYEPFLLNKNAICIRKVQSEDYLDKDFRPFTLARYYLVKID
jgi:hypothetical protein